MITKGKRHLVRVGELKFSLTEERPGHWQMGCEVAKRRSRRRFAAPSLSAAIEIAKAMIEGEEPEASGPILIEDVFARWIELQSVRPETLKIYWFYAKPFVVWAAAQGIRVWEKLRHEHLLAYVQALESEQRSPSTIKRYTFVIKSAARFALRNWGFSDFTEGFSLSRKPKRVPARIALSFEEVLSFATAYPRLAPGVVLQGLCGLRILEVLRLKWSSIRGDLLLVEGEVKNVYSARILPIPGVVLDILAQAPHDSDYVIGWVRERTRYSALVSAALRSWRPELCLEPKGLRRTIPTEAEIGGWAGYAVERYLGHTPHTVTGQSYAPEGEQLTRLLRQHVVSRIDAATAHWRKEIGGSANVIRLEGKR